MNSKRVHIVVYVNMQTHKLGLVGYNYTEAEASLVAKEFKKDHVKVHKMRQNREFDDDIEAENAVLRYAAKLKVREIAAHA